jgi:hypothetical protein
VRVVVPRTASSTTEPMNSSSSRSTMNPPIEAESAPLAGDFKKFLHTESANSDVIKAIPVGV